MALSNVHGFPRIGDKRELKFATEGYWKGERSVEELLAAGREIRLANWRFQKEAGIDLIPSNDFSLYDQVLDTIALVGAVPERYGWDGGEVDLDTYFAMARGRQDGGVDVEAMEMTKWFDTNYHYIVPELLSQMDFKLSSSKVFDEFSEANEAGVLTKPVLLGPLSFLLLGKPAGDGFNRLDLLERLLPIYIEVIEKLAGMGAQWLQLDEPCLVEDRSGEELEAFERAYKLIGEAGARPKIVVSTYFDHVGEAYPTLCTAPVDAIGLDFHRGPRNLELIDERGWPTDKTLFAGVVDGRNIWINDLDATLNLLSQLKQLIGADPVISTSCSLLHTPLDKGSESAIDAEVLAWMSFARQKVEELTILTSAASDGVEPVAAEFESNRGALLSRQGSKRTRNPAVRERLNSLSEADTKRKSPFSTRRELQRERLDLPLFPTTTIGSFPQTTELRQARQGLQQGKIDESTYGQRMREEIERVVKLQEEIGLDVLVHGEPERNDMVQYFAEQLDGYAFTSNGWVQSYGSRYVRPPVIFGDVSRPQAMTVEWAKYAQSLTGRPMKGMLTGPVTMLMWSFVRDDQPRSETCRQLALAIRDEVRDLEHAGIGIVQVDEPAIREGLPLRRERWQQYLDWAVACFRLATAAESDATQIHTHMCYSEFGDIIEAIAELDADVASVEAARSRMELLHDFERSGYDKEIGPGVYDIHSPRVPSVDEIAEKLHLAAQVLDPGQIWVNPDCGLKTRGYQETDASLRNMVAAARQLREELVPA